MSEDMAKTAIKALDKVTASRLVVCLFCAASHKDKIQFALDKTHTFRVSPYSVLVNADNTPDEYVQPEVALAEKPNLQHWLLDPRGIDQFVIRFDQTVEVDWNAYDYTKVVRKMSVLCDFSRASQTWNDPAQRQPELYWRKDAWQVRDG
jgi:hypothetical protein